MTTLKSQMAWCRRALWALGGTMLLSGVTFYFVGYAPSTRKLASLESEILTAQNDLSDTSNQSVTLSEVEAQVHLLRAKLDGAKKLPKQNDLPQFIKDITTLSQQSALRKFKYEPAVPMRNELFSSLPISLTFEGDFVNVYTFLRQIEGLQRLTRVKSIMFRPIAQAKPGQVQVQLTMNIYFSPDDDSTVR